MSSSELPHRSKSYLAKLQAAGHDAGGAPDALGRSGSPTSVRNNQRSRDKRAETGLVEEGLNIHDVAAATSSTQC